MKYRNVVAFMSSRPWAILEGTLLAMVELVELRARGHELSDEEVQARIAGGPGSSEGSTVRGGVAVIPVSGVITPRASLFADVSGGTSVEGLRNTFLDAVGDDRVDAIVLDIDSPGGAVDLVPELAGDIRAARGEKPVVAQANTLAASAAYWLGAQADSFYVTPSGQVGSVGVFGTHLDVSEAEAQAGRKTTLVSAGDYKTEGNPYEPLGDDARAHLQGLVDSSYELFVDDVAAGRGTTSAAVREGYGRGRVLGARAAWREGLVDGVQTFEETVSNLMRTGSATGELVSPVGAIALDAPVLEWSSGTLVDDAETARRSVAHVVTRMRGLAEVREGRLTAAKREALAGLAVELLELGTTIGDALEETLPAELPGDIDLAVDSTLAHAAARLRL